MDIDELNKLAAPDCECCGGTIQRVETSWKLQGQDWVPDNFTMVCNFGCRTPVKLLS